MLERRIAELRPEWLGEQPPTYTVVWLRTVLRQAEELNRKLLLASPALITDRLDKVPQVLAG